MADEKGSENLSLKNSVTPSSDSPGQSFKDIAEHESGEDSTSVGNVEDIAQLWTRAEGVTRDLSFETLAKSAVSDNPERAFQDEKISSLKNEFRVFREEVGSVCEIMEDKDVDTEEIFVENPTKIVLKDSDIRHPESMKLSKASETHAFVLSGDTLPDYTVHVSEAELLSINNTRNHNVSRYEQNFKKFIEYVESQNNTESLNKDRYKSKRGKECLKKTIKSDGTVSNIYYYADIHSITNILEKIKNISSSAPASLNDNLKYDGLSILHDKIKPEKVESQGIVALQTLEPQDTCQEITKDDKELEKTIKTDIDEELKIPADNLQFASNFTEMSLTFKVPVLPKTSGKSPKSLNPQVELSPQETSKIAAENLEKSPLCSPKRPTDFNISPRRSFYMFSPESPSGILRQCRSLPNISRPPRKELRRSSINIDKSKYRSSVRALFTEQLKSDSITPESSVSSIEIKDIENDFSASKSETESSAKYSVERGNFENTSVSKHLNRDKIRKKLIFVSNVCDNTNITPTLQESSSSSSEVSSIANLQITDSTKETLDIALEKLPPKRKHLSPDFPVGVLPINNPKKLRLCKTSRKSKDEETTEPDFPMEEHGVTVNLDSDSDIAKCANPTKSTVTNFEPEFINTTSRHLYDSVEQFKDGISKDELKSKKSAKRSPLVSPDAMDIAEILTEAKRKKESEE